MGFWALVLTAIVSCIGDLCDGREVKVLFGEVGGEVKLKPTVNPPISSITWKSDLNKAAEWETGQSEPDYYTICNSGSRCQLDHTTGELKIRHLEQNEKLNLSAEINGMAAQSFFTVIALEKESKPSIRPNCSDTQCTLVCEGKNTIYTRYSWKEKNKTIAESTTTLHVEKSDKLDKSYTCVFSNPVSTVESDPVKEVDLFPGGSSGGIIAGVLAFCVAVGCGIGIGLYYKKKGNHLMAENHQEDQSKKDNQNGENAVMEVAS
ncbi:lymphocyte function-associated antigen 3-like isoform X2 [Paramormyrops kingsleyae]|uniref:lymphocyte function-associated antigen 3-like isoform X2 n=1 Tax=Paramormyrops kingsleyae TaxID=1676925 RepID=UPI003B96F98A